MQEIVPSQPGAGAIHQPSSSLASSESQLAKLILFLRRRSKWLGRTRVVLRGWRGDYFRGKGDRSKSSVDAAGVGVRGEEGSCWTLDWAPSCLVTTLTVSIGLHIPPFQEPKFESFPRSKRATPLSGRIFKAPNPCEPHPFRSLLLFPQHHPTSRKDD